MKEIRTLESIDFNEITSVVERDCLRTSLVGDNLKNSFLRAKYFIALVRCALHVPRQGPDTNTPWRTFSQAPGNMQLSAKLIQVPIVRDIALPWQSLLSRLVLPGEPHFRRTRENSRT